MRKMRRRMRPPQASDPVPVGYLAGPFGTTGELKCDPSPAGRPLIHAGSLLLVQSANGATSEVCIAAVREHHNRLLVRLSGVDSMESAGAFAGATLQAPRDRIELNAGEYLDQDLAGCRLYDGDGTFLGSVDRIEHYPSADMIVSRGRFIPMVSEFIKSINVPERSITVDVPRGLLNDADAERA